MSETLLRDRFVHMTMHVPSDYDGGVIATRMRLMLLEPVRSS